KFRLIFISVMISPYDFQRANVLIQKGRYGTQSSLYHSVHQPGKFSFQNTPGGMEPAQGRQDGKYHNFIILGGSYA
ncbi:MAG: hypothetical protein JW704_11410, partial [Anaerolineaceae bacterium]|nr:hypothetical protein [Anaerolineaceae bacterium]